MRKIFKFISHRMVIVSLLILLQIGWLLLLFFKLTSYSQYISIGFQILSVLVVIAIMNRSDNPAVKLAWVIVILMVPVFGGMLYLYIGGKKPLVAMRNKLEPEIEKSAKQLVFDETIHDPIWAAAAKAARLAGETVDGKEEGWEECFRFDRSQMHAFWWTRIVKPAFANASPQAIGTIPSELLERYQDHLLYLYEKELPKEPPRVITPEMVWLLGDYVESILEPML